MVESKLPQSLLTEETPKKVRMIIARGHAPLPPEEMIELLVRLLKDTDAEISAQAAQTLTSWDKEEILVQLKSPECHPSVLEYFASRTSSDSMLQAVLANPSSPNALIKSLAAIAPVNMLEALLDNRVRIIDFPDILDSIRNNPAATPEILRLAQEIEVEFLGGKKKEYEVEKPGEAESIEEPSLEMEFDIPPEDLSLEGLPLDAEVREAEIIKRLSSLSVREKIRYALFGTREIRSMLVRDTNREVSRAVLRSPKLNDNEIEAIASMRSVSESILREIGGSRAWTKSYAVVHNLVRNPKTPPVISQRLLFRLRAQDLMMLSRDRSIPDAVRYNAGRALRQRTATGSPQ
jgi:hypothetical protein